jgi:hypothetical protein
MIQERGTDGVNHLDSARVSGWLSSVRRLRLRWTVGMGRAAIGLFCLLPVFACTTGEPDASEQGAAIAGEGVFGAHVIDVALTIDEAGQKALAADPKTAVPGKMTAKNETGGSVDYDVEVRLKGSYTLQGLDKKPSFKIKLPKSPGFFGMKSLTLNGMTQDPSMLHETLAYQVYSAMGTPEPRTGYATVSVNGAPYGLYVNVESIDKGFLAAHFGSDKGILYEGTYGVDLVLDDVDKFDLEEGEDAGSAELRALVAALDAPGDDVFYGASAKIDPRAFARTVAASAVLNDADNYASNRNNYRFYRDAKTSKWTLIPTGLDQSFAPTDIDPFVFDAWGIHDARVFRKCLASDRCFAEYVSALGDAAKAFESLDLARRAKATMALIDDAGQSDPRKPYTDAQTNDSRAALFTFFGKRPDSIRTSASCAVGGKETPIGVCAGAVFRGDDGTCIDVTGASHDDNARVTPYPCHGKANQRFRPTSAGDGTFSLVSIESGKCLDVDHARVDDGTPIMQYSCHGGPNQRFKLDVDGDGVSLVAVHSGKCLVRQGGSIVQASCDGTAAQRFELSRVFER